MYYIKLLNYLNIHPYCSGIKLNQHQYTCLFNELWYDNFTFDGFRRHIKNHGVVHVICDINGDDIQYPYIDLNDYYDAIEKEYTPDKYCSHVYAIYEGFNEKYSYCIYCNKTEEEITNPKP